MGSIYIGQQPFHFQLKLGKYDCNPFLYYHSSNLNMSEYSAIVNQSNNINVPFNLLFSILL